MKRIVSILLIACILFSSVAVFGDAAESAAPAAEYLVEKGILKGTEKGLELDRNVTRAEAVVIIARLLEIEIVAPFISYAVAPETFDDINGHWAYWEIFEFESRGYINGTGDGLFEPERTVSGREFVKILLTADGIEGVAIENAYDMAVVADMLTDNDLDTVVKEDKPLTRGEVAQLCYNYINTGVDISEVGFSDKLIGYMPENENYMYSPFSIRMALGLLANGAEGETQEEILKAMQIENLDEFNKKSKEAIERYLASEVIDLNVANSVWVNSDMTNAAFTDKYTEKVAKYYNAESKKVNNSNAVDEVNGWVSEATKEKITSIIDKPDFESLLINAVYFNATWLDEFDKSATEPDDFTAIDGTVKKIDFMNQTTYLGYDITDGVQVVKLPYKGDADVKMSMYLLMGEENIQNPVQVVKNSDFNSEFVALSLPKFKTEFKMQINDMLEGLGIVRGYTPAAQFAPMYGADGMWIVGSLHKTYIKVDEKGTEAAAVTVIALGKGAMPTSDPIVVKFNKPFSYVIMDDATGEALFVGRYAMAE